MHPNILIPQTLQVLPSEEREGDPTAEFSNLENSEGTLISDEINFLLGQVVDDFGCPETLDKEQVTVSSISIDHVNSWFLSNM